MYLRALTRMARTQWTVSLIPQLFVIFINKLISEYNKNSHINQSPMFTRGDPYIKETARDINAYNRGFTSSEDVGMYQDQVESVWTAKYDIAYHCEKGLSVVWRQCPQQLYN